MKILWHYNSHRHIEEYYLSSCFFNRSDFLKKHSDVLVCCNKQSIDLDELRSKCIYECESCEVVRSTNPSNGVHTGQLVALNETFHKFEKYDFVIHSTPDVYVVDDKHLIALLQEELDTDNHMIVDHHPYHPDCNYLYSTDFFIFKPRKITNFFGDEFGPTENSIESHLYKKIHALNIPHRVICRGLTSLHWQVDEYGMIHNHNKDIIRNILNNNVRPDRASARSHMRSH